MLEVSDGGTSCLSFDGEFDMETTSSEWNKLSEFRQGNSLGRTEFEEGSKEWRDREMNIAEVVTARARAEAAKHEATSERRRSCTAWMKDAAPFIVAVTGVAALYAKLKDN